MLRKLAQNSEGTYAGTTNALRHGAAFRAKYGSLYKENSTLLSHPILTEYMKLQSISLEGFR